MCVCVQLLSCARLFVTPWTIACQAPPSVGFSRQEYWNGLPFPTPVNLPDPGIEPRFSAYRHWQADSLPLHHVGSPHVYILYITHSNPQTKEKFSALRLLASMAMP